MPKPLKELIAEWEIWQEGDSERVPEEMARRLRLLDERHQPYWCELCETTERHHHGLCGGCFQGWPCPDRRILDGEEA